MFLSKRLNTLIFLSLNKELRETIKTSVMKKKYNFKSLKLLRRLGMCFAMLFSYLSMAQNINFTIDTAIDNGTSITETLTNGADTYVLTVFHSGNEELDNLGGGDLIFFLSAINPLTPFMLRVTKNGTPTDFNLNSIDYDTLASGIISVTNQDDEIISAPTSYPVGFGTLFISNPTNAIGISEIKIIPTAEFDLNNFGFHNINVDIDNTLSNEEFSTSDIDVLISPNPSNGDITIKSSGYALDKVVVSDINGRIITSHNLNGTMADKELDLSSQLTSGLYFISISSEGRTTVKKMIIK